jgi:hypothetical protein
MIVEVILVALIILIPLILIARKRNILGEFLLGMAFGAVWEAITKSLFFSWHFASVSLVIIITWGIIFVSTTYYSDLIKERWGFRSHFWPDLISSVWGFAFELVGYKVYNAWQYKPGLSGEGVLPLLDLPILLLFGWPILVLVYNNFIRVFDPAIEAWGRKRQLDFDLRNGL